MRNEKDQDRGQLPRCLTCDRPLGVGSLEEKGRFDEILTFCDVRCREDYFQRVDLLLDGDSDEEAA